MKGVTIWPKENLLVNHLLRLVKPEELFPQASPALLNLRQVQHWQITSTQVIDF